ncbi:hypothetical protein EKK58_01815 [Candidatus Dependentiae bacterium]|nr:MAG: hypothetical protein EKK58_01815 [Candidatus Dependentiae bacterium]
MNKKILFFVGIFIIQYYTARYPGIRMAQDPTPKQITVINTSDQKIFVRLKPTHVHPACASCDNMANNQEEVDDCCKSIKIVEYCIPAESAQIINLSTINVGLPDDNKKHPEYLDFTGILYAKIYNAKRTNYAYITLKNNAAYTIGSSANSIAVNAQ